MRSEAGRSSPIRRYLRNRLFLTGLIILIPLILLAVLAPVIAPSDPLKIDAVNKFQSLSREHPFGTDEFGRDVFSRVVHGAAISLRVGGLTALFTAIIGVIIGLASGFYKLLDAFVMRIMDGLMIFPGLLLGILLMAALGPHELNVVLAMTILYTPRIVRIVRGAVLEIKNQDYIDAARVVGSRRCADSVAAYLAQLSGTSDRSGHVWIRLGDSH